MSFKIELKYCHNPNSNIKPNLSTTEVVCDMKITWIYEQPTTFNPPSNHQNLYPALKDIFFAGLLISKFL